MRTASSMLASVSGFRRFCHGRSLRRRVGRCGAGCLAAAQFGHTSPIYVHVAGRTVFDRSAAEGLLAEMEQNRRHIDEKARFANDRERVGVLNVYTKAIATLRERLEE